MRSVRNRCFNFRLIKKIIFLLPFLLIPLIPNKTTHIQVEPLILATSTEIALKPKIEPIKPIPKGILLSTTTIKQLVQETFPDAPVMVLVASCESGFRQFKSDGTLLRGKVNNQDVGVLQINEFYHLETARKMGLDIHTLEGNLKYGRYLYDTQGTNPWNWSKFMWSEGECRT